MKTINFAHQHKKKLFTPIKSLFIICFFISVALFFHINQKIILQNLKKQKLFFEKKTNNFDQLIHEKQVLINKEQLLKKKAAKLEKIEKNKYPFFSIFNHITKSLGTTNSLKTLSLSGKKISIKLDCQQIKKATRCMEKIAELPFVSSLHLTSMIAHQNRFIFAITGKLS